MKAIIDGFYHNHNQVVAYKIIEELKLESCLMMYCDVIQSFKTHAKEDFVKKNVTFINFEKISLGEFPKNIDELIPLDEALLDSMNGCEVVVLKMIERMNPMLVESYDFRKNLYLKLVRFWNDYLENNRIDFYLNIEIPHEPYNFVIYSLCKLKGIKTFNLAPVAAIDDTLQIMTNWRENSLEFKETYLHLKQDGKPVNLNEKFAAHLKMQLEKDEAPFYMVDNLKIRNKEKTLKFKVEKVVKKLENLKKSPEKIAKLVSKEWWIQQGLNRKKQEQELFEAYENMSVEPDFNKKYFYYPIQFQPECTTSPQGGVYVNQELAIHLLSEALPGPEYYIYVKEHPDQRLHGRNIEFYNQLKKIKNVIFVKKSTSGFALIRNSLAVVTITGTSGWEALFRKKPVLLFGHCYYQYAPGVINVKSLNDCTLAIKKIINSADAIPDIDDMKYFLKAMEIHSIDGWTDICYQRVSKLKIEENIHNMATGILKRIKASFS